jgi:thioredoxin 1
MKLMSEVLEIQMENDYLSITDLNFNEKVFSGDLPTVVACWADWCGPCHIIAPVVEQVAKEYHNRFRVGILDVDKNPRIKNQYGINSLPTLLFFKNNNLQDRVVGVISKKELIERLNGIL